MLMRLQSGRQVDPLNLKPGDVSIEDIAHGLSLINRFNGQTRFPYSVARHSVNVSVRLEGSVELKLLGLLHDAAEVYLGDVIRPIKQAVRMQYAWVGQETFEQLEARTLNIILGALGIDVALPPTSDDQKSHPLWGPVFEADDAELSREIQGLFAQGDTVISRVFPEPEASWSEFLQQYQELKAGLRGRRVAL